MLDATGSAIDPREILQQDNVTVRITWADGKVCRYTAPDLRGVCPCAQCVNEWSGERMLKPESISEELQIEQISLVGRYALSFRWSDGHETGIYSFRLLRGLCDQVKQ